MNTLTSLLVASLALLAASPSALPDDAGAFQTVKAKSFDKEKFVFPADVRGGRLNVLFLAMSGDQDSAQYQQGALLDWYAALDERGVFSDDVVAYHFPVLSRVPFFVKGIVSRALTRSYEGKLALDQGAVLFVKDLEGFAAAAGLALDDRPTIVVAAADATPLRTFKGEVSPEGVDEIATAVEELLAE